MREPVEIARYIEDPPFGWLSRYQAIIEEDRIAIRLRIKLKSDERIPLKNILKVRAETEDSVKRYFNQRFDLVDAEGLGRTLKVFTEFTSDSPDLTVRLHSGKGRSNLNHWFIECEPIIRAHEIGHALGLHDEYIDSTAQHRATSFSPGVYRDHSLMGNFFAEGMNQAGLKPRHGSLLAKNISQATGISLIAQERTRINASASEGEVSPPGSLVADNEYGAGAPARIARV